MGNLIYLDVMRHLSAPDSDLDRATPRAGSSSTGKRVPAEWADAYAQIGRMLLIAEAATTSIGIPWVPPTRRTRALASEFSEPLKDFVRTSLVTVNTAALESYAEDLEGLPQDENAARHLHIGGLSGFERYMLNVVLFAGCFGLFFLSALWVRASIGVAIGLSLVTAFLVTMVSSYVCSEENRRATFHWLVFEELMRRRGMDQSEATPIGVLAPSNGTT